MDTITLKHIESGIYSRQNYSKSVKLELITNFLDQIGGLVELVKEGLIKDKGFYFEIVYVDVENDQVILFYVDDENDPPTTLKMPYEKFIGLLDKWWGVYKNLPDFIEISMDDEENIKIKTVEK